MGRPGSSHSAASTLLSVRSIRQLTQLLLQPIEIDRLGEELGGAQLTGSAPPFVPDEGFQKTDEEQIHTKPGGCGCDVPGTTTSSLAVVGTLLGLGALAARRRRSARS